MLWYLSFEQLMMSFLFVGCATLIGGMLADKILGYSGFNVIGNWILLLIGAYAGMYVYNLYGFRFSADAFQTIIVTSGSACALLTFGLCLKFAVRA